MFKEYLSQLKTCHLHALREQKGQTLIIFVFAILGLIAMMGLALDLGLVYIERVRVSRTTDAAALAAVVELPFEEEAIRRAAEFIELNGYNREETEIRVRGCIVNSGNLANVGDEPGQPDGVVYSGNDPVKVKPDGLVTGYVYQPALVSPPKAVFVIDTLAYQPVDRDDSSGLVETLNENTCDGAGDDPSSLFGTANKLRVAGQVTVDMNFMQFFGFGQVPVSDQAVGENVTNLDVVVVFDVSGSMDYETNCFGCWIEDSAKSADIMTNPFPSNGNFNPLEYDDPPDGNPLNDVDIFWGAGHDVCEAAPSTETDPNGFRYSVHEAEFYATNFPLNGWEFEKRQAGQGFWVLQRTGRGSNGSYIRPHPFVTYGQKQLVDNDGNLLIPNVQGGSYNDECFAPTNQCWKQTAADLGQDPPNNNPPYVEYDFTVDWDSQPQSNTHIWIRAIGGNEWSLEWFGQIAQEINPWRKSIYWVVDPPALPAVPPPGAVQGGPFLSLDDMSGERDTVDDDLWRWVKIGGGIDLANGPHTLRLYQGSAGFNLDKIIITNNPDGIVDTAVDKDGNIVGGGSLGIATVLALNGGEGPYATAGSATREACNICNPAFGETVNSAQCSCKTGSTDGTTGNPDYPAGGTGLGCTSVITPTNQLENDLFHDIDPLRSAQEAVKNFAARLDPKFDQIGVITFRNTIGDRVKLQCRRYEQNNGGPLGQKGCFDPNANHPLTTSGPVSYTRAMQLIEDQIANNATNIARGMREGLEELGISVPGYNANVDHGCEDPADADDKEACDRQGAARRVLVLMTDGAPNRDVNCDSDFNWRGLIGANYRPYDCAMFFAKAAADNNVVVYTIGIGPGVDKILLTAMAEGQVEPDSTGFNGHPSGDDAFYFNEKGGKYFPAAKPSDLDEIFDKILENIYVRIVG